MVTPSDEIERDEWVNLKGMILGSLRRRGSTVGALAKELRVSVGTLKNYLSRGSTKRPSALAQYGLRAWVLGFRPYAEMRRRARKEMTPKALAAVDETLREIDARAESMASGEVVACPLCGAEMALRTRKVDQTRFLGCVKYPACKGTLDVDEIGRPTDGKKPDPDAGMKKADENQESRFDPTDPRDA